MDNVIQLPPSVIVTQEVGTPGDVRHLRLDEAVDLTEAKGVKTQETTRTTRRVVKDIEEYEDARKVASAIRRRLGALGRNLQSGVVLVARGREDELDEHLCLSRAEATEHNEAAKHHFVRFSAVKAAITSDVEATARDLAYEIQRELGELRQAVEACDVAKIRMVASRARTFARVLDRPDAERVEAVVREARAAAKWVVRETTKKARTIEEVRAEVDLSEIDNGRAAFLRYAVPAEMEAATGADPVRFAGLARPAPDPAAEADDERIVDANRFALSA